MEEDNKTVYIVDDDEAVCDSLAMLLKSVGLTVSTYTSAIDFLEEVDIDANGCLVLDIRMPMMSGLELQNELILRGSLLPIVFISGHGDIPMAVKAVKKGAIDFIAKHFMIRICSIVFSGHCGRDRIIETHSWRRGKQGKI